MEAVFPDIFYYQQDKNTFSAYNWIYRDCIYRVGYLGLDLVI